MRRIRVGNKQHVACFDSLPAHHRRAVKGLSVFKKGFCYVGGRHRQMLLFAQCIRNTQVDEFDVVVFD